MQRNWIVLVPLAVFILAPTLLVDIPAMADYPNHLARMHLLVDAAGPDMNPYYQIVFAFYPNLAMDIVVPQLARLLDVETATRMFLLCAQLLVFLGAIAFEVTVKGRHEIAGFAALLAMPSMPFALGLVNFEFGIGLALFGIAAWIGGERWPAPVRLVIHLIFVCLLFAAHLFSLGVYGLVLGVYELRRWAVGKVNFGRLIGTAAILGAPLSLPLAALMLTGGAVGGSETTWLWSWKFAWVALFLNGYDVYLSAGSLAALIVLLAYLIIKKDLQLAPLGKWMVAAFAIVYLLMPFKLFDSRMADIRVLTAAILILPSFINYRLQGQRAALALVVISFLVVANSAYAGYIWFSYQRDYAEMKHSFKLLEPSAFVLIGSSRTGPVAATLLTDVPINRAPVLAVHYAKAFVSLFYTIAGMQPVEVQPFLKHLDISTATEDYHPPPLSMLRATAGGEAVAGAPRYLRNWTQDFQYLYLVGAPVPQAIPGVLDELARYRRFTLYRVKR